MGKTQQAKDSSSKAEIITDKRESSTRPSISASVIFKLLGFSALLFVGPIATYYYTVDTLFSGNSNYAAGAAALVANLVVIAYILVAMVEDMQSNKAEKIE
ncbi:vacuolar ATPase assembly integral membrane protein VMA21 [Halteromyces radiatus]|uniref:vacuolar ATPase assembly integral membrane protein VMA21 n=1 Tax=Halteromyces radiatus TaxID=101107 RepID=UPI0022206C0F|nr:vacuolar ATPase assembly integral membrane protein VMA21 [Halteromyces radiatus]KAI8098685.1 vacuolar ATPase assembly integral membrane protein VMA21 [Halteromyces radiatus]